MAGLKIVLPSRFTDSTLPTLSADPLLSKGSLALIDPTHPAGQWASGVPAAGQSLPNIAFEELAAIRNIPANRDELRARYVSGSGWVDATHGKIERSSKGGLHGIPKQSGTFAENAYKSLDLPPAVLAHVLENQTHSYYLSHWGRMTQPEVVNSNAAVGLVGHNTTTDGPRLIAWLTGDRPGASDPEYLGNSTDPMSFAGNKFRNTAVSRAKGTLTSSALMGRFGWGRITAALSGFPSYVTYRLYFEDLTISGRTHAEVGALDREMYVKEVQTAGGRYFGDTFTAPAG